MGNASKRGNTAIMVWKRFQTLENGDCKRFRSISQNRCPPVNNGHLKSIATGGHLFSTTRNSLKTVWNRLETFSTVSKKYLGGTQYPLMMLTRQSKSLQQIGTEFRYFYGFPFRICGRTFLHFSSEQCIFFWWVLPSPSKLLVLEQKQSGGVSKK